MQEAHARSLYIESQCQLWHCKVKYHKTCKKHNKIIMSLCCFLLFAFVFIVYCVVKSQRYKLCCAIQRNLLFLFLSVYNENDITPAWPNERCRQFLTKLFPTTLVAFFKIFHVNSKTIHLFRFIHYTNCVS